MTYELFQQGPDVYVPILLLFAIITVLAYGAFPFIFAKTRNTPITKKKYNRLCYGVNFAVMFVFILINGGAVNGAPYILWTSVFSNYGKKVLRARGVLEDADEYLEYIPDDANHDISYEYEKSTDDTLNENAQEAVIKEEIIEEHTATKADMENLPHYELDNEFGLVPSKPIYTVNIEEQEKYLKALRTFIGAPIKWSRRGSMSVNGIHGMIDIYDIYLMSGAEYKTIYISMYGAYNSTVAPKGFSLSNQPIVASKNSTKKQNPQKSKKPKTAFLTTGIVAVVAVLFVVFGIPEINYQRACSLLDKGSYNSAISLFEELDGYRRSEDKIKEAKYGYVLTHRYNNDTTTFSYLNELKKEDYKDSSIIYYNLYAWEIRVLAVNSSESDEITHKNVISKYNPVYFHFKLLGGEPGASTRITVNILYPDGDTGEYTLDGKWCDGDIIWYGWASGIYNNPTYGDIGTLRCNFYDDKGNYIGTASVTISN